MKICECLQSSDILVNLWIVFHGARTKRIGTYINTKIHSGKVGEVSNDIDLAQIWKKEIFSFDVVWYFKLEVSIIRTNDSTIQRRSIWYMLCNTSLRMVK